MQSFQQYHSISSKLMLASVNECMCLLADVTSCEPDFRVTIDAPSATPDDPDYKTQQWDMNITQVQKVWAAGNFGSQNVRVCVVRRPHCQSPSAGTFKSGRAFRVNWS